MDGEAEFLEGWVVDLACLRRYSPGDYRTIAQQHSRDCGLAAIESGYALVDDQGRALLLDRAATTKVWRVIHDSHTATGIRLRVRREPDPLGMMITDAVREIKPA